MNEQDVRDIMDEAFDTQEKHGWNAGSYVLLKAVVCALLYIASILKEPRTEVL